ncbi:MAG TPA: alpha/beta fold hydrolase [Saprospiraceae bacterium]|nr:alpha/beta fold hydrolase [Saprospiraceae bacterium]
MQLNYKTIGTGQPIIFLHGLFGMLDNWQTFGKKIADLGYQVILVDQRDHGRSPWTNDLNYTLLAQDIIAFANQIDLEQFILVGHSMGGKTAMKVTSLAPELVEKLVVIDVAPKKYKRGHDEIFKALKALHLETAQSRSELYEKLKIYLDDEMVIQFLLKNIQRNSEGDGFNIKFNIDLIEKKYDNIIDDIYLDFPISVSTLFCKGELSNYIIEEDFQIINTLFTNCNVQTIPQAGHWIHADQPDLLFKYISEFIQK